MTHGSCTEGPSASGRAGIRIQDCSLPVRELRLASALEWVSLEGTAGVGITGAMTGTTTASFTTTTHTSPTAEFSSIATTSSTPAGFTEPADFMAREQEDSVVGSMDLRRRTARIPVHSAALIMAESREATLLAVSRASAEAPMEAGVFMGVEALMEEAVAGNRQ